MDSPRTVWATCGAIYAINCVLMCMRPEIAMEFISTKWLPTDSPLLCFGTVKNSLGLYELDQKHPCVVCMKLFKVNGLSCVEINRLMHELNVLT